MIAFRKKLFYGKLLACLAVLTMLVGIIAQDLLDVAPCAKPPFLTQTLMPNVLIIFDTSGSMAQSAYWAVGYNRVTLSRWSNVRDTEYYGYADPNRNYKYNYATEIWEETDEEVTAFDPHRGVINGNFYNYAFMRRVDVARRVLVGGRVHNRSAVPNVLISQDYEGWGSYFYDYMGRLELQYDNNDLYDDGCRWLYIAQNQRVYVYRDRYNRCRNSTWRNWSYNFRLWIAPSDDYVAEGFVQRTADQVRYGFMIYDFEHGGRVTHYIPTHVDEMVDAIENVPIIGWTPLKETLYEAYMYFAAKRSTQVCIRSWDGDLVNVQHGRNCPRHYSFLDYANHDPIRSWCEQNFVIFISDGMPSQDNHVPNYIANARPHPHSTGEKADVSYYMYVNDIRDDFQNKQNVYYYGIYVFEREPLGQWTMSEAAKWGGFEKIPGQDPPWPEHTWQWDRTGDGDPDNYFFPEGGNDLEIALNSAFQDILRRTSAASAVSVVSASSRGEGAVYQALFSPDKMVVNNMVGWFGSLRSLWMDQMGNLREDTDQNQRLHMKDDNIVTVGFDGENAVVTLYQDLTGDGVHDGEIGTIISDSAKAIWDAGHLLWRRNPNSRKIYAGVPIGATMSKVEFKTANRNDLQFYLDASGASADTIINYVLGHDYPGLRPRTTDGDVWKMGDIIYSTPVYVGPPADRYDLLYNDYTYLQYYAATYERRGAVYVGANAGMIHAFNAGRYFETTDALDRGYLDDMGDYDLGEEMWGYIPHNLLPHLQWLKHPMYNYCHVFYIDNSMRSFDAKLWDPSPQQVEGWGTVLLAAQRFGGSPYILSDGTTTLRSALTAINITDPEEPELMWEWSDEFLGYTTVFPSIARVGGDWNIVYGNGPNHLDGDASGVGRIYILQMEDDNVSIAREFTLGSNEHMGSPLTLDVNLNGNTDVAYIGSTIHDRVWQNIKGKIYRVNFFGSTNPNSWQVSTLIDLERPVISQGGATMDPYGNLWYYAGTGRYYSNRDEEDVNDNYFVGIKDEHWNTGGTTISLSQLYNVTNVKVVLTEDGSLVQTPTGDMVYEEFAYLVQQHKGWYVRVTDGERILSEPLVIGETVFFTSFTPDEDPCEFGGTSKLYGLNYMTGVASPYLNVLGIEGGEYVTTVNLGHGVPTSPSVHIGTGQKATIATQLSTGEINLQKAAVAEVKSGPIFWKGK